MHLRVLLFRVFFCDSLVYHPQYPFFPSNGGENPLFAHSVCVFKQLSTANTILRSSFAASAFTDAFFVYHSRIVFGYFSPKSTFIKISFPLHLPNPPRVKDQGRTKDEPRNTQRTPNHPKVLFIKIGYLKEIFVTVTSTISLPCQMPLSISFTPLCKVSLHSRTSAKMSHR